MVRKKIKIPIFFGKLVILRVRKMTDLNAKFGLNAKDSYASLVFKKETKKGGIRYFIALQKNTKNSIIVHEAVHIVNYIFEHNGIEPDLHNDEAQAYLTGWIFEQIEKYK